MIEANDVRYSYPGDSKPVLRGVSANIERGEVVGIVGPNGSGKSTLARLIKGLLLPSAGELLVDGVNSRTGWMEIRRRVGLVFQNPSSQIVNAVVEQEVAFGPENLGLPPREVRRRVDEALAAVGMEGRATAETHSLPMAAKQRIALAAALAMQPDYLVLDEPTAWLEPTARWPLLDRVLHWARSTGAGVVLVTHRMDEAELCGRLYGLLDGQVVAQGAPDALLGNREVRERLRLEAAETAGLAKELRAAGVPAPAASGVPGLVEAIWPS